MKSTVTAPIHFLVSSGVCLLCYLKIPSSYLPKGNIFWRYIKGPQITSLLNQRKVTPASWYVVDFINNSAFSSSLLTFEVYLIHLYTRVLQKFCYERRPYSRIMYTILCYCTYSLYYPSSMCAISKELSKNKDYHWHIKHPIFADEIKKPLK